jgi:tetratricopeptide (TPR) repeat protein
LKIYFYKKALKSCELNEITKAIQYLNTSLKFQGSDSENISILNLKGLCHYRLGEFEEALKLWRKSLNDFPSNNRAEYYIRELNCVSYIVELYNNSIEEAQEGNVLNAIKMFEKENVNINGFANIMNFLGLCNYKLGYTNKAMIIWKNVLGVDSANKLAIRYLKECDINIHEKQKGIFAFLRKVFKNHDTL